MPRTTFSSREVRQLFRDARKGDQHALGALRASPDVDVQMAGDVAEMELFLDEIGKAEIAVRGHLQTATWDNDPETRQGSVDWLKKVAKAGTKSSHSAESALAFLRLRSRWPRE